MKAGANFTDVSRIKKYAAAGNSAEDISAALNIDVACVASYMPQEEKPKRKRRTKEEMAADDAEE